MQRLPVDEVDVAEAVAGAVHAVLEGCGVFALRQSVGDLVAVAAEEQILPVAGHFGAPFRGGRVDGRG